MQILRPQDISRPIRRAARKAEEKVRRERGVRTIRVKTSDPYQMYERKRRQLVDLDVKWVRPTDVPERGWKQNGERLYLSATLSPEKAARAVLQAGRWLSARRGSYDEPLDEKERESIARGYARRALRELNLS